MFKYVPIRLAAGRAQHEKARQQPENIEQSTKAIAGWLDRQQANDEPTSSIE